MGTVDMLDEIFSLKENKGKNSPGILVNELGRISTMALPPGWIAGNNFSRGTAYAKEFHPRTMSEDGKATENTNVQLIFSYRGSRLSDAASKAFRQLVDAFKESGDGKGQQVNVLGLQAKPLSEILGERSSPDIFKPAFAEVQPINGEPALVIVGKYINHDVKAKLIYVDADQNNRTEYGAPLQAVTYMAPTDEFFKYSAQVNKAISSIVWQH